jgi:uncharacterized membrane protein YedE/YeeE
MTGFTPVASFIGGVLVGVAALLLLLGTGRQAGISGIAGGLLDAQAGDRAWRAELVGGLLAGGLLLRWVRPQVFAAPAGSVLALALAGLLVGFGARWSGGCTSGHGICGLGRLSKRSLVAVMVFMTAGAIAVALLRRGGRL